MSQILFLEMFIDTAEINQFQNQLEQVEMSEFSTCSNWETRSQLDNVENPKISTHLHPVWEKWMSAGTEGKTGSEV